MGVMHESTTTSVCDGHVSFYTWPGLCLEKNDWKVSLVQHSCSSWLQLKDGFVPLPDREVITLVPVLFLAPVSLPSSPLSPVSPLSLLCP